MPTIFEADIFLDMIFLVASGVLFFYAYEATKYMKRANYRPKVIQRVAWVGIIGIFTAILEISGDLLNERLLVMAHASGMTLMSIVLIFAIRDHLRLLKSANVVER